MILDLRELFSGKKQQVPVSVQIDMSDFEQAGVHPLQKVQFNGMLKSTADVVSLSGQAEYDYAAPCDRCAVMTVRHFVLPVEHVITLSVAGEDNEDYIVVENLQLPLDDVLTTDIILSLPFQFLCSEDCKGICAGCGKNLNRETCVCKKEPDPRLAKLNEFFD